ncbi:hypothetical protein [Actinomadura fibrosa]|uniref:Uncharacterized protein n=1 Tax=Actinomadura fibrosa TaxID=111802 RepID=A0ABW2Y173_9ACTN|nr:hypothetical protein [Actinomadura fibrosa]
MREIREHPEWSWIELVVTHERWREVGDQVRDQLADVAAGAVPAPESISSWIFDLSVDDEVLGQIYEDSHKVFVEAELGPLGANTGRKIKVIAYRCPHCSYSEPGDARGPSLRGRCPEHGSLMRAANP